MIYLQVMLFNNKYLQFATPCKFSEENAVMNKSMVSAFGAFKREADPERKAALKKIALTEKAPFYLAKFEQQVLQNGGYLVGVKLTAADFFLAAFNDNARRMFSPEILDGFPRLQKHSGSILSAPGVKEYMAKRTGATPV